MRDGLSQEDRLTRITTVKPFAVIDNSMPSLLRQAEAIAAFINYYNLETQEEDGSFEQFLNDLKQIRQQYEDGTQFKANGRLEPSQALLLTFIHQLHALTETFNQRWHRYATWYIDDVLKVKPLQFEPDKVWIHFKMKPINKNILISKDLKFVIDKDPSKIFWYQLGCDFEVNKIEIAKAYSFHFEKQAGIYPTSNLDCATTLKIKDLLNDPYMRDSMFAHDNKMKHSKSLGFMLSSASLLLREGKRMVTITLMSESTDWIKFIDEANQKLSASENDIELKILNNIFYLVISTADGWQTIENYSLKRSDDGFNNLILKFVLDANFPATEACNKDIHDFESEYPTLRVHLNLDAWLYPYSWIKQFQLKAFHIDVLVERMSNILFYNELGRVDNSKPFSPFGLNTECGTGFIIGNYELSLKNIKYLDLQIEWDQLPKDEFGLQNYYKAYDLGIDNCSFRVKSYYLCDYRWKETLNTEPFYLFSSNPQHDNNIPCPDMPLVDRSQFNRILVDNMPISTLHEDEYEYSIKAKTGFVSFVLNGPEIGFGEKYYRQLFSKIMILNGLKKKNQTILNPPITPLIRRMSINYHSDDYVDLRTWVKSKTSSFFHLHPLGNKQVYPNDDTGFVSLIYSLESDANLLIALKNVAAGEHIHLYFDFESIRKESVQLGTPMLEWFWGDGYRWEKLPIGSILVDKTNNLLMSGNIELLLPSYIDEKLFDEDNLIWLRVGVPRNAAYIPELNNLYSNASCLSLRTDSNLDKEQYKQFKDLKGMLVPEKNIPNITVTEQITPFLDGRSQEDETHRMIRTSEYVTHREKAVTVRDFERMALQAFPEIAKVKCLSNFDSKGKRKGLVTLVLIPQKKSDPILNWHPKVDSVLIFRVEDYFKERVSPYVTAVDAINPEYEELTIRCRVKFKLKDHSFGICCTWLKEKCNALIAPWQTRNELPCFNAQISLKTLFDEITQESYIEAIHNLSVIQLTASSVDNYRIYEYGRDDDRLKPSKPYAIFVPAKEHIITNEEVDSFGVNEMIINETFVI